MNYIIPLLISAYLQYDCLQSESESVRPVWSPTTTASNCNACGGHCHTMIVSCVHARAQSTPHLMCRRPRWAVDCSATVRGETSCEGVALSGNDHCHFPSCATATPFVRPRRPYSTFRPAPPPPLIPISDGMTFTVDAFVRRKFLDHQLLGRHQASALTVVE